MGGIGLTTMAQATASTALALVFSLWLGASPATACGPGTDCELGERTYRIALPPASGTVGEGYGAILFMHGYRGTAAGVMENTALRQMASELGVALIAAKSGGEDWLIRNAPRQDFESDRRELEYFDALLEDVTTRFQVDPHRILATGFSAGGMMTWTLACHRSEAFAAFLPIAGTFWAPIPEACPNAPVDLVHVNGTTDTIVPIEGRPIADTHQGNAREALAMFREAGGYEAALVVGLEGLDLDCSGSATEAGAHLMLCLHEGGHVMRSEWVGWAYRTFVASD